MRLAMITGRFPVLSEPFILNQVTGALTRGWDVQVFALQGRPNATEKVHPDFDRFGLSQRTHYPPAPPEDRAARPAAIRVALEELSKTHPDAAARLSALSETSETPPWKTILRGAALAAQGPFDVIHCQFGFFADQMLALRAAGVHDAAVLTTFRGGDISRYVREQGPQVYDRTFAQGDHFFANCGFFRDKALAIGCPEDRIEVHGSGIDLSRFAFAARHQPEGGPVEIATTGRLVEKKGISYILDAIATLRAESRNVRFNILGDGPLRGALEAQAHELGISEHVVFHGWRNQAEIIEILKGCHLFVAASVTASNGDQDAPVNTLKEAMAMGLPVVATRHGGIPELVKDGKNGVLVPERNAGAIAGALIWLIHSAEDWPVLGAAGRDEVEAQFDMVRLNDRLSEVYHDLARRRREERLRHAS